MLEEQANKDNNHHKQADKIGPSQGSRRVIPPITATSSSSTATATTRHHQGLNTQAGRLLAAPLSETALQTSLGVVRLTNSPPEPVPSALHLPTDTTSTLTREDVAHVFMLDPGSALADALTKEMMHSHASNTITHDEFWQFVKANILQHPHSHGSDPSQKWDFWFRLAQNRAGLQLSTDQRVPLSIIQELFLQQQHTMEHEQDTNVTVFVTREEFAAMMEDATTNSHSSGIPALVSHVFARSMACNNLPLITRNNKSNNRIPSFLDHASAWAVDYANTIMMWLLWMISCAAIFGVYYQDVSPILVMQAGPQGPGFARGTAQLINFNTLLVLLFMCRRFLTWIRTIFGAIPPDLFLGHIIKSFVFHTVDHAVDAHKVTGLSLIVFSLIHTLCWMYLFEILGASPLDIQNTIMRTNNTDVVTSADLWCCSTPGVTGWLMILAFFIIYPFTVRAIRRSSFSLFWTAHQFLLVYIILLVIHPTLNWLHELNPIVWLALPLILYFFDVSFRVWGFILHYNRAQVDGAKTKVNGSTAIQLILNKPTTNKIGMTATNTAWSSYVPGAYAFLCVPEISKYEWHPFTIVSAPEESQIEFRIQIVGRWTKALAAYLQLNTGNGVLVQHVYLDGPFGAPTQSWKAEEFLVCIALGAGITPFLCILRSILANARVHECPSCGKEIWCASHSQHKKIVVIWVVRDAKTAFGWFETGLNAICRESRGLIEVHRFVTGDVKKEDPRGGLFQDLAEAPTEIKTYFQRPDWVVMMRSITCAAKMVSSSCGVYFCGNVVVGKVIGDLVQQINRKAMERGEDFVMTVRREVF